MKNFDEVLKYFDNLMMLTPIQESILRGTYQGKKNFQIAQELNCSESHIKKEGAKLWKLLGQELGENINKHNVRSKLAKKYRVSQGDNFGYCVQVDEGNINICEKSLQVTDKTEERSHSPQTENELPIIDLTEAPEINYNYRRDREINTIKEWLENKTRLITIYGLKGIGKTALILKLISEINTEFDYIIYKSLENTPKLINLKDSLKQVFSQTELTTEIIDYFKHFPCLVILDDLENLFKTEELAGQYLSEYEDYTQFFKQIVTKNHQSCLILISQEKSADIDILENQNNHVKTLQLKGLGESAKEIFKEKKFKYEEKWEELITLYQRHPTWLKIILGTIEQLYNGNIEDFLTEENELFIGDIKIYLQSYLKGLSESEYKVIQLLANQNQPVNITQISANLEISKPQLAVIIQSLLRRCLLEKLVIEDKFYYELNKIFKEFFKQN